MEPVLKALMPAYGGYSLARDEKVIFIKGAIPGEVVEVKIEEKKRDYSIASVVNVVEPSEYRVVPKCRVFGSCGGCQLQFVSHEKQLDMKNEILLDSLKRIGGIEAALDPVLSDAEWNYRCRAQFKVSRAHEIGFFREASREVITFDECPLMNREINVLLQKMKENGLAGNLAEIHVALGDTPVVLLKGKEYDTASFEKFIDLGISGIAYNDAIAYGGAYTGFDLNGLRYTVSPWTFFQSHWDLNRKVIDFLLDRLAPLEGKRVLDLYAGAGNFSIPLAAHAEEVVAVEENAYASDDGVRNGELNNMQNMRFVKSTAEKYRLTRKFDIVLLDPPRLGLSSEVVKKILENPPAMIVYISCNPSTLARDLKKLGEKYDLMSLRQIDFFPQTYHVESVSLLQIR